MGTYTFHEKISLLSHPIRADNFDVHATEFGARFRAFRAHALAFAQLFQHLSRHAGTMQPLRCRLPAQELCDITNARTAPRQRHLPSATCVSSRTEKSPAAAAAAAPCPRRTSPQRTELSARGLASQRAHFSQHPVRTTTSRHSAPPPTPNTNACRRWLRAGRGSGAAFSTSPGLPCSQGCMASGCTAAI